MNQDDPHSPKKDLTGILDLPQSDPVKMDEGSSDSNPFELNELKPVEQIDDFASLDQIGMMDHPPAPEEIPSEAPPPEEPPFEQPFEQPFTSEEPLDLAPVPESDPIPLILEPIPDVSPEPEIPEEIETPPKPVLDELKAYGESKKEAAFEPGIRNEFHLLITGDFDLHSRDKLLLFLTENSIGITSSELDFQIKGKRVLLPRISEFSGVKLIQDLRDSGLAFILKNSDQEADLPADDGRSRDFHFEAKELSKTIEVPILPTNEFNSSEYLVLDSIRMVQYLQAEILEVERSELFQELLDRMTEALRMRAQLKGATALTHLNHRITPLRLPSQYQIELTASLLKRI